MFWLFYPNLIILLQQAIDDSVVSLPRKRKSTTASLVAMDCDSPPTKISTGPYPGEFKYFFWKRFKNKDLISFFSFKVLSLNILMAPKLGKTHWCQRRFAQYVAFLSHTKIWLVTSSFDTKSNTNFAINVSSH